MKKFPLLLAAVAMIAVGSAFATPKDADPSETYVLTSSGYQLKSDVIDEGRCEDRTSQHCEYTKNALGNYIPSDNDRAWVEF